MFRGGSTINLDAKGRLAFPTRYRTVLDERCQGRVVLTVHDDRCLLLYPFPDWDEIERKLVRLPNQEKRTRTLQRMLLGHATELEIDNWQGWAINLKSGMKKPGSAIVLIGFRRSRAAASCPTPWKR